MQAGLNPGQPPRLCIVIAMFAFEAVLCATSDMTHYWDCCKPSCGWDGGQGASRIAERSMCDSHGSKVGAAGLSATSSCDAKGAGIITCPDQQPFHDKASGVWMRFVASQDRGN